MIIKILRTLIVYYSPFTPLIFIALSIAISPWWSPLVNALSDLGHPRYISSAILFNFGLVFSGYLIAIQATLTTRKLSIGEVVHLYILGITLILVGTFNEAYTSVHYIVSVILFITMLSYITYVTIYYRRLWLTPCILAFILAWYANMVAKVIEGIAIPELISILMTYTAYSTTTLIRLRS